MNVLLNVVALVVPVLLEDLMAASALSELEPLTALVSAVVEAKLTGPAALSALLAVLVGVLLPSDPVHLAVPRVTRLLVGPPSRETFRLKSLRILRSRPLVVRFSRTVKDAPFSNPTSRLGLPTLLGTGTGIGFVNTLVILLPLSTLLRCLETIEVKVLPTDLVMGVVNPVYRLTAFLIYLVWASILGLLGVGLNLYVALSYRPVLSTVC